MMNNKMNLIKEYSNLLFFWFVGVVYFFIFRLTFIFLYRSDISDGVSFMDYVKGCFMGFRFDVTVVTYFLIIPFLSIIILIPLKKVKLVKQIRKVFQVLFIILSVLISVITLNYYKEYKNQFDYYLFMGLYDDQKAVVQSIIEEFNPFLNLFVIIISIIVLIRVFRYYEDKTLIANGLNHLKLKYKSFIFSVLMLLFLTVSVRGSFTEYPVRRFYASVTSDEFINKTIINPFRQLTYAIEDFKELNDKDAVNPYGEVSNYAKDYRTINELIHKKTDTVISKIKPKQLFLIVMESYDRYCLISDYTKIANINPYLKNIEKNGISFVNFLPSSNGTMNSFTSVITTIPYTGVNMSIIGATNSYPSSIFNLFKEIGYETNFFYGGYLSWQNIKNFTRKQGADHIYGAGNIKGKKGIWGVSDEDLFNKVLQTVDTTKNSLNVILTLSYHSPFEVDVVSKGFPYKTMEDLPKDLQKIYNESKLPLKTFGHLWYADKAIGEFVKKAENKYKHSLFAFTGDHWGRKNMDNNPNLYKKSAVPFILYGNGIDSQNITTISGSHIDITPTLFEMVAPKNYDYYSFGENLLKSKNKKFAVGFHKLITNELIQAYSQTAIRQQVFNKELDIIKSLKRKHDSVLSLGWHYTHKGNNLK